MRVVDLLCILRRSIAALAILSVTGPAVAADPYPLEYFALREVIQNVSISPDGKRLLLLNNPDRDGNPHLEIYKASNLKKKPLRIDADPMEITRAQWANNNDVLVSLRRQVRNEDAQLNDSVYETRIARLDVDRKKMTTFQEANPVIENVLPHDADKIILSMQPDDPDDIGLRLLETFRPRDYYEFDLSKGTKSLIIRGKPDLGNIDFDEYGEPWLARGFKAADGEYVWYRRGVDGWQEFHRLHEDSHESFNVYGIDPQDPDSVLVVAENGNDKQGLWIYNTVTNKFGELIYRRDDVDVTGVRMHTNQWTDQDTISGVSYYKDRSHHEYFDEMEAGTYLQLERLIPNAHRTIISSRSRDGQALTIYNDGPNDPGSYYLIKDAALKKVGSKQPLLVPDQLANVEYITYKARDGKSIPAFVTRPHGEPPFPLIVLPHGGPFVQEFVNYDEWSQMLANNGYMVLQPQFRGSRGYGAKFYLSAINGGGQGGYAMQDDKDDGALHLVAQGLVDKDRIAMFGWSYGGYAALVAASRTPQIYQCVMAGAAVNDTEVQARYYDNQLRGHGRDQQLSMWDDSISPVEEVEKVNVPVLVIHGSVDQRVPLASARQYVGLLEKYGKDHKYVEIEGAGHFSDVFYFEHQIKLYKSLVDFLENDCGPGGL